MVTCPKCGHANRDNTTNCESCLVNLAFATAHPDTFADTRSATAVAALERAAALETWAATTLDKWQYKAVQQPFRHIDMAAIDALGASGWELVSVMPSTKTSGFLALVGVDGFTNTDSVVFFMRRRLPLGQSG